MYQLYNVMYNVWDRLPTDSVPRTVYTPESQLSALSYIQIYITISTIKHGIVTKL